MFTRRKSDVAAPEVGAEAPEFNLPSAQGGQLRLSMRTVRGPVVVAFYRPGNEEDVGYFKALAEKEQEINMAAASVVGIGVAEPSAAREFARESGLKSYLLYDYARVTSAQWGLLERDRRRGDSSRPSVFIVGPDGNVAHAWTGERPAVDELLEKVSAITGLPKKPEEEKPAEADEAAGEKPKKMSAEEREKIKAERRAAREAGASVKTAEPAQPEAGAGEGPKKMSKEERDRIKAERRAARESGQSLKSGAPAASAETAEAPAEAAAEAPAGAPKKMSAEERERIKAERRAAREAGASVKTGSAETAPPAGVEEGEGASEGAAAPAPAKMSKEERERIKAERRAARESGQSLKKPTGEGSSGDDGDAAPGETEEKA